MNNVRTFTLKANQGRINVLTTPVHIHISTTTTFTTINAIWDTGATGCAISKSVVQKLGLTPTGKVQVHTANGVTAQNTHIIDIRLTNDVVIQGIIATEVDALSNECEALIEMDVISMGDLSITHLNGNTCMSFRVPSLHEIDFTKNPHFGIVQNKINLKQPISRNGLCNCNSGKKFKHCCGK